jgi:hypothetical protein
VGIERILKSFSSFLSSNSLLAYEISQEKNMLKRTILIEGIDFWRGRMPLFVRICLQDLRSKTFNISDNNFHLKSSFSGMSGAFIYITRGGL